ncbi:MAG: hypothetical protein ACXU8N_07795 [Telluria sp.]
MALSKPVVGASCVLVLTVALIGLQHALAPPLQVRPVQAAAPAQQAPVPAAPAAPVQPQAWRGATARLANPLEKAPDLRAVFDRYRASSDPAERHAAWRAWSACFPAFLPPAGESPSVEAATRGIPTDHPEQAQAYQQLFGRCRGFFTLPRDAVLDESHRQNLAFRHGAALAPGAAVLRQFEQGEAEAAVGDARAIIAAGDPYAIYSLREFMERYLAQRRGEATQADEPPDLRALAFYLAPCELGMECGPDSLTALELCAHRGLCSGSVQDRYLASFPATVDRDALRRTAATVAEAIRAGNLAALGL